MAASGARLSLAAVLAGYCLVSGSGVLADSTSDATRRTDQMAYEVAMKCFVANGVARGNRLDVGDRTGANAFERKARESFDVAGNLSDALGYSGSRLNQDLGMAQTRELPKLVADAAYLRRTLAMCKAAGL